MSRKHYENLDFHIWRVRYIPHEKWRDEILINGTDEALRIFIEALKDSIADFHKYGKSTRKFSCNPPKDFDVIEYAKGKKTEIQWLDLLIVKMNSEIPEVTRNVEDKTVTVWLNETAVQEYIEGAKGMYDSEGRYAHGRGVPGGLWFSPDWVGAE